jgi:hypothetical protein
MLKNKLAFVEKELQQAKTDNAVLARYISARRKKKEDQRKEEAHKKVEEDACKKAEEGRASRISRLGGSSHPRMVQWPLPSC